MNGKCKVESQSNTYFPNTSLTIDDNKKDRMPTMDHCKYSLFSQFQKSQFLLDTPLPPLTLDIIIKNNNFLSECYPINGLHLNKKMIVRTEKNSWMFGEFAFRRSSLRSLRC